jgi:hypothetical protein
LYSACISGSCLGALETMSVVIDLLLRIQRTNQDTSLRYLAWLNFLWLILVHTGVVLTASSVMGALATGLLQPRWFYYAMVFLIPFCLIFAYEGANLVARLDPEDVLDYISVFVGGTIMMLSVTGSLPLLRAARLGEYVTLEKV